MRVVLISRVLPAVVGYSALLRELGHEPVALMCSRELAERYGGLGDLLAGAPADLDVVIPASRDRIAPLLRPLEPDVAFCMGFPWKIPADALGVPKHGIVNGHPSLLPRYRGPSPVAWAIRNGEPEIGFTLHYMDAELDTGNVLGQVRIPLDDAQSWEDLEPKFGPAIGGIFPSVLDRVEQRRPGRSAARGGGDLLLLLRARVRLDRLGAAGCRDRAAGSRLALPLTGSAARGADGAGRRGRARARREPRARGRPRDALR